MIVSQYIPYSTYRYSNIEVLWVIVGMNPYDTTTTGLRLMAILRLLVERMVVPFRDPVRPFGYIPVNLIQW